ncbi:MAG TPA: aspartyl protease family protein [Gaiellaceae bacterium]|nr:aspartyl protease family protein [Gaiellaceae bacterium]
MSGRVPFGRIHHLVTVPVRAGEVETTFVLDTGIGPTLLTESLARQVGCESTGDVFTGSRMSGQEVSLPLARVPSLAFGDLELRDFEVGILDTTGFPPELAEIGGFLSLAFFAEHAFTVDYPAGCIVLGSAPAGGIPVEIEVERDGPSLDVFLPLTLPGGVEISAEVDMGSDALILDERFAAEVGVDLDAPEVRRVEGTDETGGTFTRWFTTLPGRIEPTGAPELAQAQPDVMFQRIVHDGLVGDAFLRRQPVTYDIRTSTVIFGLARAV